MSETTVVTDVETPESTPFYKNRKFIGYAVAATAVTAAVVYLKFKLNSSDSESDTTDSSDNLSSEK